MKTIRGISLWQPWASAISTGAKMIETRHWPTNYRGPVVIHASKRRIVSELDFFQCCANWRGALAELIQAKPIFKFRDDLPFGALVAVGNLIDCVPTTDVDIYDLTRNRFSDALKGAERASHRWTEKQMGDYRAGRFASIFDDIRRLPEPIPFLGKQGWFNVPENLLPEEMRSAK